MLTSAFGSSMAGQGQGSLGFLWQGLLLKGGAVSCKGAQNAPEAGLCIWLIPHTRLSIYPCLTTCKTSAQCDMEGVK